MCYVAAMKPTILVCGHGPGISDAVARRFGREGFAVAIVARNAERLKAAAEALSGAGLTAKAFPCDLGDPKAVLAIAKSAQHKTAGLLHHKLAGEGVYVGEVVVLATVKGTAFDSGNATLEASAVAERFWQLHQRRTEASVNIP